jgi:hypothetical protein
MVARKVKAALDAADEGLVGMFLHFKGRNTEITEETQRCAEIFEVFLRRLCEGSARLCVTPGTQRAQRVFWEFFSVPSVKALRDSV